MNIFEIALPKGYLWIFPDYEGGVGGLFFWKIIFNVKNILPIIAYININLYVIFFPYSRFFYSTSGSYPSNTTLGIIIPIISDMFKIKVSNWVTWPLFYALNQLPDNLAWQFNINGLPIPATTCPIIIQAKL